MARENGFVLRAVALTALIVVAPSAAFAQALSVLHIRVVLLDAEQQGTPIPRHALLISDNPATAAPRRVVTALDGTVDVRLRPGNYTVESDQPVAFQGKAYQWTATLDIVAGRDAVLELSAANAEVGPVTSATATLAAPVETDPLVLLRPWQDSIVAIWTSTTRAAGFLVDPRGLVATSQRAIGTATSLEVQLNPTVKVTGRVVVSDPVRDVAIVWIDPKALEAVRTVPPGCAVGAKPPVVEGQDLFAFDVPLAEQKSLTSGSVSRVESQAYTTDFRLAGDSAGGPVFAATGDVVGIVSGVDDRDNRLRRQFRVVKIENACDVLAAAESKMADGTPPDGIHLSVEPAQPFPVDALKEAAKRRAGGLSPYHVSASDFDIGFITPILAYAGQQQREQSGARDGSGVTRLPATQQGLAGPLADFGNWSSYVAAIPPVLLVRVTPKLVESFWTTVARGAAQTQGVSLPALKHFKPGFSRMQVFCGDAALTPIHPFRIEQRVSESDAIYEGLYVFDPGALGPHCGTVKLVVYSEKDPEKGETRVIEAKVIQQIWDDFAPYRALKQDGR